MMSIIHKPSASPNSDNKGSSRGLFEYLSKEDDAKNHFEKGHFFSDEKDLVRIQEATQGIDSNKGKLGKDEYKYYMLTINPSDKEQAHLLPKGKNEVLALTPKEQSIYESRLRDYSRKVMDNYAASFNKGLKGSDMRYYAKIEHTRAYKHTDALVKNGTVKNGSLKKGRQSHIHIVVSRYNKETTKKLSPLSQNRAVSENTKLGKSKASQGFNHLDFKVSNEQSFDKQFNYKREDKEKTLFALAEKTKKSQSSASTDSKEKENNLSSLEKLDMQVFGDVKGTYYEAKEISRNPLSPTENSGINQKMLEQDTVNVFASELKNMNPISSFVKEQKEQLKSAMNYAGN